MKKMLLGVDVSPVARLRVQGIYDTPDPVALIPSVQTGGADLVTLQITSDRKYIHDRDIRLAREITQGSFNLAIEPHDELLALTLALAPHSVSLIPEDTSCGLDLIKIGTQVEHIQKKLSAIGCNTAVFIEPDSAQLHCALECGFTRVILNTTSYAKDCTRGCFNDSENFNRIAAVAKEAVDSKIQVGARGGLDYHNIEAIASLTPLSFVEIGHSIISRAMICGLSQAVTIMKATISAARNNDF